MRSSRPRIEPRREHPIESVRVTLTLCEGGVGNAPPGGALRDIRGHERSPFVNHLSLHADEADAE